MTLQDEDPVESVPYQVVRDSPTIKYYTEWRVFEEKRRLPVEESVAGVPCWASGRYDAYILGDEIRVGRHPEALLAGIRPGSYPRMAWLKPMGLAEIDTRMMVVHAHRWHAGVAVLVPPATIVRMPVRILSVGGGTGYSGHHVTVFAGRGSRVRVEIHDAAPPGARGLKTLIIEAAAEQSAHLSIRTVSASSPGAAVYHRKVVALGAGGLVEARSKVVGGGFTHYREDYVLDGIRSEARVDLRLASSGTCRLDAISNAVHRGAKTRSLIKARGAVMDKGYLTHRGLVRILGDAWDSETDIDSLLLLLSRGAKANAVPMLEIETSRVSSARHAASVASLEEDQLFYIASRGLSREEAMSMLLRDLLGEGEDAAGVPWTCQ